MAESYPGAYQGGAGMEKPNNNLVWAIVSLICGCLPLGIAALVFSLQVDNKWQMGDYQGAIDSAKKAKTFAMIAIIISVVLAIAYALLWVLVLGTATTISTFTTVTTFR